MNDYVAELRAHLAKYKRSRLGVSEDGVWEHTGASYPHILPQSLQKLNILETYRAEFWESLPAWNPAVKLHRDFHHLNSSQAMAFNLLFPLTSTRAQRILLDALGLVGDIEQAKFEEVVDPHEGTNFDFVLTLKSRARVFFELKLSESTFGSTADDSSHQEKFRTIYQPRLVGKVTDECLKPDLFFRNYQVLRSICHLNAGSPDQLYFIVPQKNSRLANIKSFLASHLEASIKEQVRLMYLEELSGEIVDLCVDDGMLRAHFLLFREKYVVSEANA